MPFERVSSLILNKCHPAKPPKKAIMFQTYTTTSNSQYSTDRVAALRSRMKKQNIDWFLVPHADEHQNEYLPKHAERLAWISGFSGSAGFAIIGLEEAYIFVDGRYTAQVKTQIDLDVFEPKDLIVTPPSSFISKAAKFGHTIGYDPMLITIAGLTKWEAAANKCKAKLAPTENLISAIWKDAPSPPRKVIKIHDDKYAGESATNKIEKVKAILEDDRCDALLLTDPASLAWIFNIRGNDVEHNPLALGYAIIPTAENEKPFLIVAKSKITDENRGYLQKLCTLIEPRDFEKILTAQATGAHFHCDPDLVSSALADIITKAKGKIIQKRDPIILLRALKNTIEIQGSRDAHLRDGVACTKFLHWLQNQTPNTISEIDAAKKLEEFRALTAIDMNSELLEISFDTISGAGANGAIVHYRVTNDSNAVLENNSLYLVDSGGQYIDGTTDITRTIAIGTPPDDAITDFTLVLRGHINIALARFPKGTRGVDIDVLARMPLWQHGKDYAHGTGHGVGSYMNVHEGPQGISKRAMEPFKAGMIISNEPGYYLEGKYGIRIENLVVVKETDEPNNAMLGFETLTLCPIDANLIDPSIMSDNELHWLNAYHGHVQRQISDYLNEDENIWLAKATKPISKELPAASA